MTFSPSSFLIGVGTVIVTIGVGFGGGILVTEALVGNKDQRETSKLEQRAAPAKVAPVAASVVPIVETKPVEAPAPVAAAAQSSQPPPSPSPAAQNAYAKAADVDVRRETRREARARRAEERRAAAEHRHMRAEERREIARARREERKVERQAQRSSTERTADPQRVDLFNFD